MEEIYKSNRLCFSAFIGGESSFFNEDDEDEDDGEEDEDLKTDPVYMMDLSVSFMCTSVCNSTVSL